MEKNRLFSDWVIEWLEKKSSFVKASTMAAYTNIAVTHLLPNFRGVKLSDVSEERVQEYVIMLLKAGRLDGDGGLAVHYVKDIAVVIKSILHDAMKQRLIPKVDFEVKVPQSNSLPRVKTIGKSDQQRLVQAICLDLSSRSAGILLALYTGMRIGEICGLRWSDINLDDSMLHVRRTLQRIYSRKVDGSGKSHIHIGTPKTRTSTRDIPLSTFLMPVLKRLNPDDPEAFFLSGTHKCVEVRTFRDFFVRFLKRNDIEPINFHALRHTFASRCIEAGADCKTVSEILGHATVAMTMNLYVHPLPEQKRKCVELVSAWN